MPNSPKIEELKTFVGKGSHPFAIMEFMAEKGLDPHKLDKIEVEDDKVGLKEYNNIIDYLADHSPQTANMINGNDNGFSADKSGPSTLESIWEIFFGNEKNNISRDEKDGINSLLNLDTGQQILMSKSGVSVFHNQKDVEVEFSKDGKSFISKHKKDGNLTGSSIGVTEIASHITYDLSHNTDKKGIGCKNVCSVNYNNDGELVLDINPNTKFDLSFDVGNGVSLEYDAKTKTLSKHTKIDGKEQVEEMQSAPDKAGHFCLNIAQAEKGKSILDQAKALTHLAKDVEEQAQQLAAEHKPKKSKEAGIGL